MKLQTIIPLGKAENSINYDASLILIGSCFSENIGNKLSYYKFNLSVNPFGILFHPKAIEQLISNCIHKKKYTEKDIFYHNERWHCFDAHSSLSSIDKNTLLKNLNTAITDTHDKLQKTTHIIITLGTSWVYTHNETTETVVNCHKVPQKEFKKNILSIDSIIASLKNINSLIKSINKNCTIIYTVSPVRHLKDGFINNLQSKSHLIAAIHQVLDKNTAYFPSYEIMMDELRDYRFYNKDMIHPNETAIDYIWERFDETWLSSTELHIRKEIDKIQKSLNHRPFNLESESQSIFSEKLKNRILNFKKNNPNIKL